MANSSASTALLALLLLGWMPLGARALVPPPESVSSRHGPQSAKVQCMKRVMAANRRTFYVEAERLCAARAHGPLMATTGSPSRPPTP